MNGLVFLRTAFNTTLGVFCCCASVLLLAGTWIGIKRAIKKSNQ